jgi:AcrR family transcriptional regulator
MLDETRLEGKAVASAMKLAEQRDWDSIGLREIAEAAGLTLADLRDAGIDSKTAVLIAMLTEVDRDVLRHTPQPDATDTPRDRLFEVLMARLDALQPYKAALKSVSKSVPFDAALMRQVWSSQAWMLEAAGISSAGLRGGVKAAGLATVYAQVFRVWLDDDDPGLARTMAALDRRLRRGEQVIGSIDEALQGIQRVGDTLAGFLRRAREKRNAGAAEAMAGSAPSSSSDQPPPGTFADSPPGPQTSPSG